MQRASRKLALTLVATFATPALAYQGNGFRGPFEAKMPTDIDRSEKTETGDTVLVSIAIHNEARPTRLKCDAKGSVRLVGPGANAILNSYVESFIVRPHQSFHQFFSYDRSEYGEDYRPIKYSQKVEPVCLTIEVGENASQVPPPHTLCDPDVNDCDWGCDAAADDPSVCRDRFNDWPRAGW
jgi:hypothetical protein